jgi:fused signal recognition particle receptor
MFEFFKKRFRTALKRATENVGEEDIQEDIQEEKSTKRAEEKKKEQEEFKESDEKGVEKEKKKKKKQDREEQRKQEQLESKEEIKVQSEKIQQDEAGKQGKENKEDKKQQGKGEEESDDEPEPEKEQDKGKKGSKEGSLAETGKEATEEDIKEEKSKPGFFKRLISGVTKTKISQQKFDDIFWEIELVLLENNVAYGVIEKIKEDLSEELIGKEVSRTKLQQEIENSIKKSIEEILIEPFDLVQKIKDIQNNSNTDSKQSHIIFKQSHVISKKPYVLCFLGINGSGKTTTLAKVGHLLKQEGLSSVFAASDTFRAAAIQQLENHAKRLGIKMIKHDYGADAAAVGYDAIEHAKSKGIDVVLIDSAGRLHSNRNLMDELRKLIRVTKPDLKVFVGEMITGNDCIEQAQKFDEAVGIDAVILTKSDVDEKGGTAISIGYVLKKPIIFLGTGQNYKDLEKFDKDLILSNLFG